MMLRMRRGGASAVLGAAMLAGTLGLTACGGVSVQRSATAVASPSASTTDQQPSSTSSAASTTSAPGASATSTRTPPAVKATTKPRAKPTARPSVKPAPKPSVTPSTKPTPKPSTPAPPAAPAEGDTLHPGDSGAYVKTVQQRLSSLGYWLGSPDGSYGGLTTQAVMALQKAAGIGRDGVYGPATRRALQAGIRPSSRIGGTGIEIDKARQLLLVVRGGQVSTILNTSTGSGQAYQSRGQTAIATTPAGSYSVFRSVDHLDKGPLGDLWRPRYFNGGIAVHGAGSVPGYPASHGCARVSNPAMDMIWAGNLMPIGSRVVVY